MNKLEKAKILIQKVKALRGESVPSLLREEISMFTNSLSDRLGSAVERQTSQRLEKVVSKIYSNSEIGKLISRINTFEKNLERTDRDSKSRIDSTVKDMESRLSEQSSKIDKSRKQSDISYKYVLEEVKNLARDLASEHKALKEEHKSILKTISQVIKDIDEMASSADLKDKASVKSVSDLKEEIRKIRADLVKKMGSVPDRGGSMNRQIKVGGVDVLKTYTDINLVAGTGISITAANDNGPDKNIDITITATGDQSVTLRDVSDNSTTTPNSLYQMTSAIPVEFRSSATTGSSTLLYLDESNRRISAGTSSTSGFFLITNFTPASVGTSPGTAAENVLTVTGAAGGATSIGTTGVGGIGAPISLTAGAGGLPTAATTRTGGAGGQITITSGAGGSPTGGTTNTGAAGGSLTLMTGAGGTGIEGNGGASGNMSMSTGNGGASTDGTGGASGSFTIQPGVPGNSTNGAGGASGSCIIFLRNGASGGTTGGNAGDIILLQTPFGTGGQGGSGNGGTGSDITSRTGNGGASTSANGGRAGDWTHTAGNGGNGNAGTGTGGAGGNMFITLGNGGTGLTSGTGGSFYLLPGSGSADGNVFLGVNSSGTARGNVAVGTNSAPTGRIFIAAGTASASTAPIKFNSGTLNTTPEAGAMEYLTDKAYIVITTGAARKEFTLNDATLTATRVPFATTNGRLTDSSDITFSGTRLTVTDLTVTNGPILTGFTSGSVLFAGTSGQITQDNASFFFDDTNNRLGVGTSSTVSAKIHSLATTEQLRLGYDASNFASFTTSSGGDLTVTASGGEILFDNENVILNSNISSTAVGRLTVYGTQSTRYITGLQSPTTLVGALTIRFDDNAQVNALVLEDRDVTFPASTNLAMSWNLATDSATTAIRAGFIAMQKEQTWTSTASTQDSAMIFATALNGNVAEKMRITSDGYIQPSSRVLGVQGADVASAGDLTLGGGNVFEITGTTTINAITTSGWTLGSTVILTFAASLTVKNNTAGGGGTAVILLSGSVDFSATAGDTLQLTYSEQGGTNAWRETGGRVVI